MRFVKEMIIGTDCYKLQKQMEFLQTHSDFSLCFNAIIIYYEAENRYALFPDQLLFNSEIVTIEDLIDSNIIGNFSSCMCRTNIIRKLPEGLFDLYTVDWMFNMACARLGKIGFMRDWMSIYRIHPSGAWSSKSGLDQCQQLLSYIDAYDQFFGRQYVEHFAKLKEQLTVYYDSLMISSNHIPHNEILIIRAIKHPRKAVKKLWELFFSLVKRINIKRFWIFQTKVDIIFIDTVFPHPLSPFRLQEYCSYLEYFPNSLVLSNGEDSPAFKETRSLKVILEEFQNCNHKFSLKTKIIARHIDGYNAKLAYMVFLNIVSVFLTTLENKKIPFVFTLYPGGGFKVDDRKSDSELRRVFKSKQFRKVIVTQQITYDYLVNNRFCPEDKIEFIYGVVTPLDILSKTRNCQKLSFGFEKRTLDICFVAHKYMDKGIDKGYDVFIDVAKNLAKVHDNIRFHVVGNFEKGDISIEGLEEKITFYGMKAADWFDQFYSDKDIILSPNIPFVIFKGSFDGFPTASCTEAGLRKVAIFCTDELKLNKYFIDNQEIVIIPHDSRRIVQIIESYFENPSRLRDIGEKGAVKIQEIYSYENQILPRIKVLENELKSIKSEAKHG